MSIAIEKLKTQLRAVCYVLPILEAYFWHNFVVTCTNAHFLGLIILHWLSTNVVFHESKYS